MLFPVGYKIRVDSSSMLGANKNMIYKEVTRTMQEYENDKDVSQIFKFYEIEKVEKFQELGDRLSLRIFPLFT